MNFDTDVAIFISFLTANLILGLYSSRGIKTIKEYAVGDRNFSTATIAATLVATWVSGSDFFTYLSEAYSNGLYFIWAATGDVFCLLLIGYFFAPRLAEFLGKLSIAEAMGDLYGKNVRIITAIAGCIGASGIIAVQLKVAGLLFEYCFGVPGIYGVIISGVIVAIYSSLGGIKSVTFTDIIQLFTFGTIIPTIAFFIVESLDNLEILINNLKTNELFNYKQVFDFTQPKSLSYLFLFFFIAVPGFNPAIFQRVAMAKNTNQIRKSFIIAGFTCLFITLAMSWIGVLILTVTPGLEPNNVVKYLLASYSYVGIKGIILSGIMAMVMSTVDSYINSTSVLFVHDFCKPLGIKIAKNELISSRIAAFVITTFALLLTLSGDNLINLIITTNSFYLPIVTVPFIMSTLGFRSSSKSVLIGMGAGFVTVIIWKSFLSVESVDSVIPGMLANLLFLIGSHYLLKQKGGWVGIKDNTALINIRNERRLKLKRFLLSVKTFRLMEICKKNCPVGEGLISILGLFVMVSVFSSTQILAKEYQEQYAYLINILYPVTLCAATALISYPLWLPSWKETNLIGITWNLIMFSVLICFSFLMVLISQISEIQLMVFMVNIIIVSSLITWRWALFTIIFGVGVTTFCYQQYISEDLPDDLLSAQFKIVYLLMLIISTLVTFLKPKQEHQELTELKVDNLNYKITEQKQELIKTMQIKQEFLRNIQHEARTPITGITSLGQVLYENYDKLTDQQKRQGLQEVAKSSERLTSLVNNLIDLSKLSSMTYKLEITNINLTELVYQRIAVCRKLYVEDKYKELQEFILNIDDGIMANCDKHYITASIDNLIINAIQYCPKDKIIIQLIKNKQKEIEFNIKDEGIGIPRDELYDIFEAFIVSSRTKTPAGGRGVGLALCKKVIELHNGRIWAENNKDKGMTFRFTLPN